MRQLLLELDVTAPHLVGFSMGGGVVLHLAEMPGSAPRSLTLLSAIGVQELELLGNYHLNHLVHGAQLWGLRACQWLLPQFGVLDDGMLSVEYARNFYDTDQRPLRGLLERFEAPLLILHGPDDPLVPVAAAREHHRIVPHSELSLLDGSHFLPFRKAPEVAEALRPFFERVENYAWLFRNGNIGRQIAGVIPEGLNFLGGSQNGEQTLYAPALATQSNLFFLQIRQFFAQPDAFPGKLAQQFILLSRSNRQFFQLPFPLF